VHRACQEFAHERVERRVMVFRVGPSRSERFFVERQGGRCVPPTRGCSAEVVLDVEPDLSIAFVVTDVFPGTVSNFRKHLRHLPRPTSVPG